MKRAGRAFIDASCEDDKDIDVTTRSRARGGRSISGAADGLRISAESSSAKRRRARSSGDRPFSSLCLRSGVVHTDRNILFTSPRLCDINIYLHQKGLPQYTRTETPCFFLSFRSLFFIFSHPPSPSPPPVSLPRIANVPLVATAWPVPWRSPRPVRTD